MRVRARIHEEGEEATAQGTTASRLSSTTQSEAGEPFCPTGLTESVFGINRRESLPEIRPSPTRSLLSDPEQLVTRKDTARDPAALDDRQHESAAGSAVSTISANECSDAAPPEDTALQSSSSPTTLQHAKNKSSGQTASYEDHGSHERGDSDDGGHACTATTRCSREQESSRNAVDLSPGSTRRESSGPSEQSVSVVIPGRQFSPSNTSERMQSCKTRSTRKRRHQFRPTSDVDFDDPADDDYIDGGSSSVEADIEPYQSRRSSKRQKANPVHKIVPHRTPRDPQRVSSTVATLHRPGTSALQYSSTSLGNIQTIPIRGFLTREMCLSKVVWSFSFQEDQESFLPTDSEAEAVSHQRYNSGHELGSKRARRQAIKGTQFSADEDALLIDLKEVDRLSWSEIAKHFPGRSTGSLQVRYSTKLKTRRPRADVVRIGRNSRPRGRPPRSRREAGHNSH
ncbi:hypothetical protein Plec18170_009725 [Paecilomyces lecythidis]